MIDLDHDFVVHVDYAGYRLVTINLRDDVIVHVIYVQDRLS